MAKDYGGLVFYRTKEGKLRYFDPNKAKTAEGKAKIKAIRSGKSKNAFIGTKDTIKNEVRKQANVERAKAEENARLANNKYSKAVTKARAEREDIIAARKKKSQADNKARQALNEQRRVNDPIDYGRNERDKLNVQRALKKADERKKPAWVQNPNFNYKKYGKYFDDKGVLKKETAGEYLKAYAQARKSADGIREKEANEKSKRETFRKATEAVNAKKTNKEKWLEAKSELKRAQYDAEQFNDKESKERLAKAKEEYKKANDAYYHDPNGRSAEEVFKNKLKQNEESNKELDKLKAEYEKADDNKKLELAQKITNIQKKRREKGITNNDVSRAGVAARKEKANWENEFDKQAKEADKQVNSIDKLDDWTKKQIEPVKNLSSEEAMSRYKELSSRAQKGGPGSLSKEEENERRALANRLQDKGTGKLKDVLADKYNSKEVGDVSPEASKEVEKNVKESLKKAGILAKEVSKTEKLRLEKRAKALENYDGGVWYGEGWDNVIKHSKVGESGIIDDEGDEVVIAKKYGKDRFAGDEWMYIIKKKVVEERYGGDIKKAFKDESGYQINGAKMKERGFKAVTQKKNAWKK